MKSYSEPVRELRNSMFIAFGRCDYHWNYDEFCFCELSNTSVSTSCVKRHIRSQRASMFSTSWESWRVWRQPKNGTTWRIRSAKVWKRGWATENDRRQFMMDVAHAMHYHWQPWMDCSMAWNGAKSRRGRSRLELISSKHNDWSGSLTKKPRLRRFDSNPDY